MFESSRRFAFFENYRIPYREAGSAARAVEGVRLETVRVSEEPERALHFPSWLDGAGRQRVFVLGDTPLFGRLLDDDAMATLLATAVPGEWRRTGAATAASGLSATTWTNADGSIALPFDPDELTHVFLSEAYQEIGGTPISVRLGRLGRHAYYRVRPALFSASRTWVRRAFARVQRRARFPGWPLETALHDLHDQLLVMLADVAGRSIPLLAPWPNGHSWALVLTHDVETADGYANVGLLCDVERAAGYRSSWNFVPRRYTTHDADVEALNADGFEVGVHGLYHDGHDLGSVEKIRERLPEMHSWAKRWHAVGFRSPSTHRRWEWMPMLGFDYDMSYSDTAPYEPQPGGCCSWLPFFIGSLVEIPITLPQDHTMFVVLDEGDGAMWHDKSDVIRERGGMAHMLTHPDYLAEPPRLDAYREFLLRYRDDRTAWKALPRDVSDWWRRRAASHLERSGDGWRIVGPAADDGTVVYAGSDGQHETGKRSRLVRPHWLNTVVTG
jgi:hypothetical protein